MLSSDQKIICEKKAKNRIKNYFSFYCMICGKKLGILNSIEKINIENIEHKLCENCSNIINAKDKIKLFLYINNSWLMAFLLRRIKRDK